MENKPIWVDQPFGSKICQINFPITTDSLKWVLASMVWWIMPDSNIPRTQIICTRGETPGNVPIPIFAKSYLENMKHTYQYFILALRREKAVIKDIGWKVIKYGVALPNKNAVLEELGVEMKNYDMYKYITKKDYQDI